MSPLEGQIIGGMLPCWTMTGRRFRERRATSAFGLWNNSLLKPRCSPSTFRYFGRAKDLPGVRELFQSRKKDEDEDNQTLAYYKKFMNQGPAYYGDLDEGDGTLLKYEQEAEDEGKVAIAVPTCCFYPTVSFRMGRSFLFNSGGTWST